MRAVTSTIAWCLPLCSITGANGARSVSFDYDDDCLLEQAGALDLHRDQATGLVTGSTLANIEDGYGYSLFGELETYDAVAGSQSLISITYTRDKLGRIATKSESVDGGSWMVESYDYDLAGRLTDVTRNGTAVAHYEFDLNGNRNGGFNQVCGLISNAVIDDQDRLLSIDCGNNTISQTYSANGELQTRTITPPSPQAPTTTEYQYDSLGNLLAVTLPTSDVIEYIVDARNRRTGKKINGVLVQGWLYQDQLEPVAEFDGNGDVVARFVYGSKPHSPDYMVKDGVTYRLITDHLGSVRLVVDATTGVIAQRLDFDEFGNVLADTNSGFQPFGFAGGLYDQDTGFVRFGARDYDSLTGRWVAKAPIRFGAKTLSLYTYVGDDPVNFVDPFGLEAAPVPSQPMDWGVDPASAAAATKDFVDNYLDMREAWFKDGDKYFHCKANCEAAQRGATGEGSPT